MEYAKLNRRRNCLKGRMNRLCQDLDALIREQRCQEAQDAVEAVISDDDELEKETQKWMDFEREIRSARGRAERYLGMNTEPVDSKKSSLNSVSAKLLTWSTPKFTGNVLDFPSFWEQFNAGIHDNAELADVTKFIYLRSLLEGEGLKAIDGYAVTQDNYPIHRQALVCRFGNPKRVIEHHIQAIADLRPNGDRTLRELHDELVTHVRSLKALNRDTSGNQFASDIILTLCKRLLPKKILSLWEEKILESEEDPNEVETFFAFLHKHAEIEARVHQDNQKHGRQDRVKIKKKEHRHSNKVLSTSAAPGNLCSICRENHYVEKCPLFLKATRPERWALAKKYRLCFRCLRQGHRSTDCKRRHNSRNVTSIGLHRLLSEDRNVRAAEENCTPHEDERSEKSPETTPTDVSEPTNAVRVKIEQETSEVGRTCKQLKRSQRSFVTKGIADSLGLTGLSERVCISTLGNNTCHKKLRRAKQINAYCVNRICDTLEENPPVMWEHAKDLNLADDFHVTVAMSTF
ncbi:hypothetical protein T4A_11345 [Trichinella pseudospiralis]|uniref:CCHC-type domain-containing protein n=1 Tax=Trichinella pseudospiralis TaxID=6337 RepID=A0A0V1EY81_TRIPS|nr:hypothetical protein T4A_11345 [Trichinella pseudospiralis]